MSARFNVWELVRTVFETYAGWYIITTSLSHSATTTWILFSAFMGSLAAIHIALRLFWLRRIRRSIKLIGLLMASWGTGIWLLVSPSISWSQRNIGIGLLCVIILILALVALHYVLEQTYFVADSVEERTSARLWQDKKSQQGSRRKLPRVLSRLPEWMDEEYMDLDQKADMGA